MRDFDPEYFEFGYIMEGSDTEPKEKCAECGENVSLPSLFFLCFIFLCLCFSHLFGKMVLRKFLTLRSGLHVTKG